MTNVAIIAPPKLLRFTAGRYQMVLPQLVKQNGVYKDYYKSSTAYKIMDNGEAEGEQLDFGEVCELASELKCDEIILPDKMGDSRETMRRVKEAEYWTKLYPGFRFTAVAHGPTNAEVVQSIHFYEDESHVDGLALPRILGNTIDPLTRYWIATSLRNLIITRFKGVHMLGATKWPREAALFAELDQVRGIDTSLPVSLALQGVRIETREASGRTRDRNFLRAESTGGKQDELIRWNIDGYRFWAEAPEGKV